MTNRIQAALTEHAFHLITPMHIDDVNGPWQVECNCDAPPVQGPSFLGAEAEFAMHQAEAVEAVLFSDEAVERVAVALWNHDFPSNPINDVSELLEWTRGRRLEQARAVIAALKGDA